MVMGSNRRFLGLVTAPTLGFLLAGCSSGDAASLRAPSPEGGTSSPVDMTMTPPSMQNSTSGAANDPTLNTPSAGGTGPVADNPVAGSSMGGTTPVAGQASTAGEQPNATGGSGGATPQGGGGAPAAGSGGAPEAAGADATSGANSTLAGSGNIADCPAAPADASPEAAEALRIITEARIAAGAGCITLVSELSTAALNHCEYYAANDGQCTADPHSEVDGCTGFTGTSGGARARAAGYQGQSSFEVMAFANDPQQAINLWINSVWHRLPILSPWVTEMGYGNAEGCDTIDFGRGMPLPDDTVVVYPYPDQVGVPPSFQGNQEGPEPPAPPTGWPSGIPINVYAQGVQVTEHTLTLDGDDTPIEHMWLIPAEQDLLRDEVFLYSYAPLEPMTRYRVRIVGTFVGGELNLDWTFETGESRGRGF